METGPVRAAIGKGRVKLARQTSKYWLPAVALTAVLAAPLAGLPASAASAPTDQAVAWQINAAHDGSQSDPIVPPLAPAWSDEFGGSVSYPLVAGGMVFVTVQDVASSRLFALDAATGQLVWGPIDLGGRGTADLAYDTGRVFVNQGNALLAAYDAQTGARDWIEFGGGLTPVTSNGILYIGGVAYSEATGGRLFGATPAPQYPPVQGLGAAAVTSTGWYMSNRCGDVFDFNPADGTQIWHVAGTCQGGLTGLTPVVHGGFVYAIASDTNPPNGHILDAQTGQSVGTFQSLPEPAFDGAFGFFLERPTATTYSLQARPLNGGPSTWSFSGDGQLIGTPLVVNGVVYIGSESGNLYALNDTTGAQVWMDNAGAPFTTSQSLAAGLGTLVVPVSNRLDAYVKAPSTASPSRVRPSPRKVFPSTRLTSRATPTRAAAPTPSAGGRLPVRGLKTSASLPRAQVTPGVPQDPMVAYQVDALHRGNQGTDPLTPPLRQRWSVDLSTQGADLVSYPVIADGKVFVTAARACPPSITCNDSFVFALDQLDGHIVWSADLGGTQGTFSAAAWDAGRLYVFNGDGQLRAFDGKTGLLIWSQSYGSPNGAGNYGSPLVARDGYIYIKGMLPGRDAALLKIRQSDGTAWWDDRDGFATHGAPAVTPDGSIYLSTSDGGVMKIDQYGSTRWSAGGAAFGGTTSTPVVDGSLIYARSNYSGGPVGYTWDTSNPTPTQPVTVSGAFTADPSPAIDGPIGFFMNHGILQMELLSNNEIQWEATSDVPLVGAPMVANGVVYQTSQAGDIFAADELTGNLLWAGNVGAPITAPNESQFIQLTGIGIGQGVLVVPASSTVTAFESGGPSPSAALPALSNGAYGGYVSEAVIMNTGNAAASVSIKYFDQAGNVVGAGDSNVSLPVNGSWVVHQDNGHSFQPGQAGSAVIFSDQPVAAFVNEFAPGTGGDASSYTAVDLHHGAGTTLYAPAMANDAYGGYTTGIGLLNLGTSPTVVTITYRDENGAVVKNAGVAGLAGHGYIGLYSGDPALGLPRGFAGTATISSDGQPLAAVVNEVGPGGQFSSYDAVAGGKLRLQAPVALNNAFGGYDTGMGIQNVTAVQGTVTVTYYDSNGSATTKTMAIKPNGYLGVYQGDPQLGPPPSASGYTAVIGSTVPIAAIVNEVAPRSWNQSTAYNTFSGGQATSHLALVENAGPDAWTTGLGIMNTGPTSESVTVVYYDASTGHQVGNALTQTLGPNAFWPVYQPATGLPAGIRATAIVSTPQPGQVGVICNEQGASAFMSYDGM